MYHKPPTTEAQLMTRAVAMSGLTVRQLAEIVSENIPPDLKQHKGWLGQLVERYLGASAHSKAAPDFEALSIELKTIPVDESGTSRESTYVCTVPLLELANVSWEASWVYRKLSHVLWVPIITPPLTALPDRLIGMPLLWRPAAEEAASLRADWQELTDMIALGQLEQVTAYHGNILQIRPKAADGRALCWGINEEGERFLTLPRGFYLRSRFTTALMQKYFQLQK
ncbi:MAG: mismatch repair protein [Gammaproteobacteria bacterium]|jgi:DNA mismatch repair protein MutH|nr:mismatch repair protein [Gammaproteobacteria bacterium]